MKKNMIIVGAGLAGLSAALQAVKEGCSVKLISSLPSERAQSVMAEAVSTPHLIPREKMTVHRNITKIR